MTEILIPTLIVAAIGLIAGLGLAAASIVFAVPVDEKAQQIRECLPGANCGACGFSGCDGYASALSKGETADCSRCTPGGNDTAKEIASIMGLEAGEIKPMAAAVMCAGRCENTPDKLEYSGVQSCKMAAGLFGGQKTCSYGCLGFGDCVKVCQYDAIFLYDGVAMVNASNCVACKMCINECPRHIIDLFPVGKKSAAVLCKNHDKGGQTRKDCKAGCIGCMKCVKVCEAGAVTINNFCAEVDYDKCTACGKCHEACPVGCIDIFEIASAGSR